MGIRVVVPPKMRVAVAHAIHEQCSEFSYHPYILVALEAACKWLAENPIVPTDEQVADMKLKLIPVHPHWANIIAEWQRRMFLAPEPERQDLISIANDLTSDPNWRSSDLYHSLLKAFRLGEEFAKRESR